MGIATPEIFWMAKPIFESLRQMDRELKLSRTQRESGTDYRYFLEQSQSKDGAGQIIADTLRNKCLLPSVCPLLT
jgi:hypothetical protein